MTLDFVDWIKNKKRGQIGEPKTGAKSVTIDTNSSVGKVQVFESDSTLLRQVVILNDVSVLPIDQTTDSTALTTWRHDHQRRREVCQRLVKHVTDTAKQTHAPKSKPLNKIKATLRAAALNNVVASLIDSGADTESFLPDAKLALVLPATYPSLLALTTQVVPYLFAGVALTIQSDAQCSPHVAYLIDLLVHFGVPSAVLNQLINFDLTNEGQIASFVLLDDADVDSALDAALASQLVYGIPCVKVFVQDSLKSAVQQVLTHKLQVQNPESDLYFENELFDQTVSEAKVNLDAVNLESSQAGLDVLYFRTAGEALKMVNYLAGPWRLRLVSVWSETAGLGLKVAQSVQSCKSVLVNTGHTAPTNWFGAWQFELIAPSAHSRLAADNAQLPLKLAQLNKSWSSSVATRVRTVHSVLDSLKLSSLKTAIHRSTKEVEDETPVNKVFLNHYEPIGQVVVQLAADHSEDDTSLMVFALNALVYGNSLVVVASAATNKQLTTWNQIQDLLDKHGAVGVLHTVITDHTVNVGSTSTGAVQLVDGQRTVGLFVDLNRFDHQHFARLLRRVRRSVVITLPEFDMTKIVE